MNDACESHCLPCPGTCLSLFGSDHNAGTTEIIGMLIAGVTETHSSDVIVQISLDTDHVTTTCEWGISLWEGLTYISFTM